ncbi:MAG: hypothetical protein RL174_728 [Actinomycetota bacterium]
MIVSGVKLASPAVDLILELEAAGILTVIFFGGVVALGVVFVITLEVNFGAGFGFNLKIIGAAVCLIGMK